MFNVSNNFTEMFGFFTMFDGSLETAYLQQRSKIILDKLSSSLEPEHQKFLKALEENNPIMLQELIGTNYANVNVKLEFNDGGDEYRATMLAIAIIYHAITNKDTLACVAVSIKWEFEKLTNAKFL